MRYLRNLKFDAGGHHSHIHLVVNATPTCSERGNFLFFPRGKQTSGSCFHPSFSYLKNNDNSIKFQEL